ncbi:hypothetical protein GZ77_14185 [Endozoicomonas montiporae]|uniref:Lipoprotein n=2 Tax=Endozoicomonas montiporae TaxID=1027273 RepID=A0A081N4Y0_9GAMM|nr:hypothetical protein [Endozoicomonas montiporae]AMO57628.1 hypothetical protein EZMO1_3665 [Endozoicomonas montiporae CL-33]KEQ13503.1 hypothetical protein GZ77_14185 [Endozoicomonas montiporae]
MHHQKHCQTNQPSGSKSLLISLLLVFTAIITGCGSTQAEQEESHEFLTLDVNELKMTMLADISTIIFSDDELSNDVKTDITRLAITPLRKSSEIKIAGTDQETRPIAVSFQKAFEQSLVNMVDESHITQATAIIHTRKPTTPLCNPAGKSLTATLPLTMQDDAMRRKTIEDRTITLRRMARSAPIDLYVAYVHDGLNQRSPAEQAIYRGEVSNPENISLHDLEMACTEMPDDIVGASYVLTTKRGNSLYFGNNGKQAADGNGNTLWRYWFGGLQSAPVDKRYHQVLDYLRECGLDIEL